MNNRYTPPHPPLAPHPPPALTISRTDQGKLPSLLEAFEAYDRDDSNYSFFRFMFGYVGFSLSGLGLLAVLIEVPWLKDYLLSENGVIDPADLLCIPIHIIGAILFLYLAMITDLMPTKPVGRNVKHGFELAMLFAAVILRFCGAYEVNNLVFCSAFICLFHAFYRLQRHPPDLGWSDWFLEQLMQVAACANSNYAIVYAVACSVVICYRFYSYSCPEVSRVSASYQSFGSANYQTFGSEESC